jgi:hypothetical protein
MLPQPLADQFDESSPRYFGWRVVAGLFLVVVAAWGFGFYGQGVYLAEFSRRFGWPVAAIAGASTVFYLVSAFLTVFISDALARFGPRRRDFSCIRSHSLSPCSAGRKRGSRLRQRRRLR